MTDWIMIVITAVYVIATIIICYSNYKMMIISQEQMTEIKKQFIESRNSSHMPILKVEKIDDCNSINGEVTYYIDDASSQNSYPNILFFIISNIGHDVAQNVSYKWENYNNENITYHIASLPVNDFRIVKVIFMSKIDASSFYSPSMSITFTDINKILYIQELNFSLNSEYGKVKFINTSISVPKLTTNRF